MIHLPRLELLVLQPLHYFTTDDKLFLQYLRSSPEKRQDIKHASIRFDNIDLCVIYLALKIML